MMGSISPENCDVKLDNLTLQSLDLMQQIVRRKLQLQDQMKNGSINLAKSRYIMGNRCVSMTQLPTEGGPLFTALCTIQHSGIVEDGIESTAFSLMRNKPAPKKPLSTEGTGPEGPDMPLSCDPLSWFGLLVPQNLRQAQTSFKTAIELVVEIANLQAKLEALRFEFCTLKLGTLKLSK